MKKKLLTVTAGPCDIVYDRRVERSVLHEYLLVCSGVIIMARIAVSEICKNKMKSHRLFFEVALILFCVELSMQSLN